MTARRAHNNGDEHVGFVDESGTPVLAVSEAQMREVDRVAIEHTGPNLFQMMENAGRNVAISAIRNMGRDGRSVVVLAGTGGNGGGGIAAARHLANRGVDVRVAVTSPDGLGDVPRQQLDVAQMSGARVIGIESLNTEPPPALVIDAVIGYSLRGAPNGAARQLIEWANAVDAPVLSLDVPSGVHATTGETPGVHVRANTTMTLALPKRGLVAEAAGELALGDIGIGLDTFRRAGVKLEQSPFRDTFLIPLFRSG